MSPGKAKAYNSNFGEPWRLVGPREELTCYSLFDREGREVLRTPGDTPKDEMIARRALDAVNGVVNFAPDQLASLAEKWNRNALLEE